MGVEVAIAAAVISTVATAAGHAAQGKGQEAAYKYNADINERNADASSASIISTARNYHSAEGKCK